MKRTVLLAAALALVSVCGPSWAQSTRCPRKAGGFTCGFSAAGTTPLLTPPTPNDGHPVAIVGTLLITEHGATLTGTSNDNGSVTSLGFEGLGFDGTCTSGADAATPGTLDFSLDEGPVWSFVIDNDGSLRFISSIPNVVLVGICK